MKVSERNVGGAFQQCITFNLDFISCTRAINLSAFIYKYNKTLDCHAHKVFDFKRGLGFGLL